MRVLFDTNVLLDAVVGEQPHFEVCDKILELCADGKIDGYVAGFSIPTMYYILRKRKTDAERREIVRAICKIVKIVNFDMQMLLSAAGRTEFKDFEDCLQDECAAAVSADYIVTANLKDFTHSVVRAITPQELLAKVN